MQRLDEAAVAAGKLARQPSWEARGTLLLGEIRAMLDDPKGAVDALGRGLELDPLAKGALNSAFHYKKVLARSLLQLGRPAEARQAIEATLARNGIGGLEPEAEWLMSRAWLQEGKIKEAAAALALAGSYRSENPMVPEPSPFVGAASCVSCHREESRTHEKSRHARTFHHGRDLLALPFPDRPLLDPDDPKVTHTFKRDKDSIKVETRAGDKVYQLIVEYAFGIKDRYVTMIGRDDERSYRALRLSSYHTADGVAWGRSSGDVPESDSPENVRGAPIKVRDGVVRCLYCHTTYYRDFRDPLPETGVGPEAADSAIGCERCHGPGGNHLKAIKAGFADNAIVNAGIGGAQAIGKLCADCHIVGYIADIKRAPEDPEFVRSPGLTMTFSRCFTESDGGMSCLTCHDAHRDDQGPPAFYEAKCLTCHASQAVAPKVKPGGKQASACPVSPTKNCLECHMPKVPVAALHTSLTDHYIRVRERSKKK
jgi:cytochrome c554/c'-like protein